MSTPEIVFVDQSGQLGGAELCLADLAPAFGAHGRVVLFSDGPLVGLLRSRQVAVSVLEAAGAMMVRKDAGLMELLGRAPAILRQVMRLRREMRNVDVAYLNTAKALLIGTMASPGLGIRRIFHLHDILTTAHFSAANIRLLVGAANRTSLVIANSRATEGAFRAAGGSAPVEVVPNGFDGAVFDAVTAAEVAAVREKENPSGGPVVSIFGRITRWKGHDLLLGAMHAFPAATVWIVGAPLFTEDDGRFEEELRSLANERVRFLGFRSDIPILMRASDVVVHASRAPEPFGRVIVEAMLAERAVIAGHAGGAAEIVVDEETGLLFKPGNAESLQRALGKLLSDESIRQAMGRAGRLRAQSLYGLERVIKKTQALVSRVSLE